MKKITDDQMMKVSYETPQIDIITVLMNSSMLVGRPTDTDPEEQI